MSLSSQKHAVEPKAAGKENGWYESMQGIMYVADGAVQFSDDWDHWRNAFCRLLEIPEEKAKAYIETAVAVAREKFSKLLSELSVDERIICLKESTTRTLYGDRERAGSKPNTVPDSWGTDLEGGRADTIFSHTISGNPSRIVVGNKEHEYAWLIDPSTNKPVAADSIVYDTGYFSTGPQAHYGMKHYLAQVDWRMEKSRRLVRTVLHNLGDLSKKWLAQPEKVEVLDVGSAIGYFRKAFSEHGFQHFGTELSTDMIEQCKERFGFETWNGGIAELGTVAPGRKFQIISLWDVIEHLHEVSDSIGVLKEYLADDGVLVIRTPNLVAFEADILGDYYYSYKLDHVLYFSPHSMTKMMEKLGLKPLYVETDSHIFKGVLGADYLFKKGRALQGADILAVYGRK